MERNTDQHLDISWSSFGFNSMVASSLSIERGKNKMGTSLVSSTSTLVERCGVVGKWISCRFLSPSWQTRKTCYNCGIPGRDLLRPSLPLRPIFFFYLGQSYLGQVPCLGQAYPQYSPCWCEGATEGQRRHSHKHCLCTPSDFQQAFLWSITGQKNAKFWASHPPHP